ncbi:MAG: Fur family transcriptional regulator [Corynebacterium sp.]|nr:Fur family transcriptional regulator [Corynebacterium sp.]
MSISGSQSPKLGQRSTRQRQAVISVLRNLDNFASAKDIYDAIKAQGSNVGLTTVYRTLQALADTHAVDVLVMANGETVYRSCERDEHHHHLVCTCCGKTVELNGGPVEAWAHAQAEANGFKLKSHTAEVFGICTECQDKGCEQKEAPAH